VPVVPKYIEEYFSTFLYSGTGAAQTITNGIDFLTKGGLVWYKRRSGTSDHGLVDTARGMTSGSSPILASNLTDSQIAVNNYVIANTDGFSFGSDATGTNANASGSTYVSWSWAKAPKFFDVVTWTGNGSFPRTIAHALGSQPGCIIAKKTSSAEDWYVSHRATPNPYVDNLFLNTTAAVSSGAGTFDNVTSTSFETYMNANGATYVAYLFAHDAGGFGLTGTDNVISCGSYTGNGSTNGPVIDLGYEPQWVMIKRTSDVSNWGMFDNMRGIPTGSGDAELRANSSAAENSESGNQLDLTATGFQLKETFSGINASGSTYIYIAIRRGPMKVPTTGTSVFDISTVSTSSGPVPGPTPTDMTLNKPDYTSPNDWRANDRLRGNGLSLFPNTTNAESNENYVYFDFQSGLRLNSWPVAVAIWYNFKRAPGFFDEVCYTGTGSATTFAHNLGVAPELLIVKKRNGAETWWVLSSLLSIGSATLRLNGNQNGGGSSAQWNDTFPTSSVFSVGSDSSTNGSGSTYVAYMFATCPGVSKVGSYTGNGTTQAIACGFTGGARFVLIKRTDNDGDWYVWDSARGIVAGDDPYLLLNSDAAEVTNTDYVDTAATGFEISSTAPAAINASGGSFIFLAVA
jgi:hypothetical protein